MFKKYTKSLFEKEMINHYNEREDMGSSGHQKQERPRPSQHNEPQQPIQQQGASVYTSTAVEQQELRQDAPQRPSFEERQQQNMSIPSMMQQEYTSLSEDDFSSEEDWNEKIAALPSSPSFHPDNFDEEPETTLGEGVVFKRTLNFKRYLRVDGTFEGELISDGKLIIGPKGVVKSNLKMHEVIVEGYVEGSVEVEERIELRGDAQIHGDITARSLSVDDGVTIIGHVCVKPDISIEIDVSEEKKASKKKK